MTEFAIGQHGWPRCPQPQLPPEQIPYATFGILQASPAATQVPRKQHPLAAHASPAQQGCPGPPQAPHEPALHVPPWYGHVAPLAAHVLRSQQPPPLQALSGQQSSFGPPHGWHVVPSQVVPVAVHVPLSQHG